MASLSKRHFLHHYGINIEKAVEELCDPFNIKARSYGRLSDQLRQFMGSWDGHVKSWMDESGLPVYLMRYEDLRRDAEATFGEGEIFCQPLLTRN